jgi:hypothetical protein
MIACVKSGTDAHSANMLNLWELSQDICKESHTSIQKEMDVTVSFIVQYGAYRTVISNGKDQCIKLWDIRKMQNYSEAKQFSRASFDYRYAISDDSNLPSNIPDASIMTYRGHVVSRTLIRWYVLLDCIGNTVATL